MCRCAFAQAAWLQEDGKGIIIGSLIDQHATDGWDVDGEKRPLRKYTARRAQAYMAYGVEGLRIPLTVGANIKFAHASQAGDNSFAVEDPELFARVKLLQYGQHHVALEPFIKLPSSTNDSAGAPRLVGNIHTDIGTRLYYGQNFSWLGQDHFSQTVAGFRRRAGPLDHQWEFEQTLGLNLSGGYMLLLQGFRTQSTAEILPQAIATSSAGNYDVSKAQLSLLIPIEEDIRLQLGYGWDIDGKNTIQMQGWSLGLWRNF